MSLETLILIWLFCPFVASAMAYKKGQGPVDFFMAGLFFGPFGVLWAWAAKPMTRVEPPVPPAQAERTDPSAPESD